MKKLLLSLFMIASVQLFAQKDLQLFMDSPATNQNIYGQQLFNISYSVKNNGTVDIAATDSIIIYIAINNQVLTEFVVNGHGVITAGQTKTGKLNDVSMNIPTTTMGANFCLIGTLTYNGNLDTMMTNNQACALVNLMANTGLNEAKADHEVSIYPNPASDLINMEYESPKETNITVFDLTGKRLVQIAGHSGINKIDVSTFKAGMYLYEISTTDGEIMKTGKFSVSN